MDMTPSPLAAIDAGSNTIHLTVARPTADGRDLAYLADELELVRLGADVSATGAIGPERMERAIAVVRTQAELARAKGASVVLGIATEGVRAASNGGGLLARLRAEAGITFTLVTGDQEAALTYWGATSGLEDGGARRAVLDLGGGSLEIVVGEGSDVQWRVSLPLGSGAMHDRLAPSDPAQTEELAAVRAETARTLATLAPPLPVHVALVAGGTATTLGTLAERALPGTGSGGAADPELSPAMLDALVTLLQSMPATEVARRYGIDEGRARLLAAGAMVLLAAMERLGVGALRVRRRGIREGAILAYHRWGEGWPEAAAEGRGW